MAKTGKDLNVSDHASGEMLHSIIEAARDSIVVLDRDLKIIFQNRVEPGLTKEDAIGIRLPDLADEPSRAMVEQVLTMVLKTGESATYETEYQRPGDEIVYFESIASAIMSDGEVERIIVVSRDISARRRAEHALTEANEQVHAVFNTLPDLYFEVDRDGRIYDYRTPDDDLLHVAPESFLNKRVRDVLPADAARIIDDAIAKADESGHYRGPAFSLQTPAGLKWFEPSFAVRGSKSSDARFVGTVRDVTEQKQTEEDLRKKERYNRKLFEQSSIGLALCRMNGELVEVNRVFARIIGRSVEETLDLTYWDLTPKKYANLKQRQLKSLIKTGHYGPYEIEYTHKDGHLVPVRLQGSLVDESGDTYIWSSVEDVADRKHAEYALRSSQEMLQLVLDSIPVRVFWKDRNSVYLGCNRHFANDGGLESAEQIIGSNDYDLGWHEQAELYRADDEEVMKTGVAKLNYEEPQTAPDGSLLWLQTSKVPLKDPDGTVIGVMGVYEDITERKRSILKLQESERRQADAQRLAKFGYWELDLVGGKLDWSDEIYRIFEIDPEKFGASYEAFLDAVHPDDRELVDTAYTDSVKNKTPYQIEHRLRLAGGKIKHVQERCETFYDDDGNPLRSVGSVQDVTDRVNMEAALRRSQKMEAVGQLSGGIAHDFNNQLLVIIGYLDMLEGSLAEDDSSRQWVQAATNGALHCSDLTRRLLAFSGRRRAEKTQVDFNAVLSDLETMIARSLTPEIEVQYFLADGLWPVEIDAGEFQDAVLNLVINARDSMRDGGSLLIESANIGLAEGFITPSPELETGDYVQLTFSDNGCGMDMETLERIFEPFFTTKPEGDGTGLGLAMVYGFVKRCGGDIKVYSELGIGTTIRIYLPRCASSQPELHADEDEEAEWPTGNESILIVDDEVALLALAEQCLKKLGYRAHVAESGIGALAILAGEQEIDLLFSDVVMPGGMNGYELALEATQLRPELKVLLTSGFASEKIVRSGRARFARNILAKPYRMADLAQRIRFVLDEETTT